LLSLVANGDQARQPRRMALGPEIFGEPFPG